MPGYRDLVERLASIPAEARNIAMTRMLRDLNQLRALDPAFVETLCGTAFVPNLAGDLRSPAHLYDPR